MKAKMIEHKQGQSESDREKGRKVLSLMPDRDDRCVGRGYGDDITAQ